MSKEMKLIMENWRRYLEEAYGLDTTWDNLHIDDVFKITGRSCDEGKKCIPYTTKDLEALLKNKPIVDTLDPERVEKANPEYPLIVVVSNGEYRYIMDGNHRFANAVILFSSTWFCRNKISASFSMTTNKSFSPIRVLIRSTISCEIKVLLTASSPGNITFTRGR